MKVYFVVLIVGIILFANTTLALGKYTVLTQLPGVEATTDLPTYLPAMFRLSIAIAAGMAFVMITFGGITYATSDAINSKNDGKAYIENALWGLGLVIGAYVILNTINPKILNFDLSVPQPEFKKGETVVIATPSTPDSGSGSKLPWYPLSAEDLKMEETLRQQLKEKSGGRVTVNAEPCKETNKTSGCTNLVGLTENAEYGVLFLQSSCKCNIRITGGTEGGHLSHGPGKAVLDLDDTSAVLENYITKQAEKLGVPIVDTPYGKLYTIRLSDSPTAPQATFLRELSPHHWHVTFN